MLLEMDVKYGLMFHAGWKQRKGWHSVKKRITIPYRDEQGYLHGTVCVEVNWECPICGQPMGEPKCTHYSEDGDFYSAHIWANPCGHLVQYSQLRPKEVLPPFYRTHAAEGL